MISFPDQVILRRMTLVIVSAQDLGRGAGGHMVELEFTHAGMHIGLEVCSLYGDKNA